MAELVAPFALREPRRVAPDFIPSGHWQGTNDQYAGITTKDGDKFYFTS